MPAPLPSARTTQSSRWPLPPTQLTAAGAGLLLLIVITSLTFTKWLLIDGRDAALDAILFRAAELGQTGRHDGAFFLGCQMRNNGYTVDEVLSVYGDFNDQLPATDTKGRRSAFTYGEFEAAVRSAFRGKMRKPWSFDATKRGRK